MFNISTKSMQWGEETLTLETGKVALHAAGFLHIRRRPFGADRIVDRHAIGAGFRMEADVLMTHQPLVCLDHVTDLNRFLSNTLSNSCSGTIFRQ